MVRKLLSSSPTLRAALNRALAASFRVAPRERASAPFRLARASCPVDHPGPGGPLLPRVALRAERLGFPG
eukprot:5082126-Pyramimonas_sp.AAC.1